MDAKTLGALTKFAPDLMDEVERRAALLERIASLQPVGRRALALRMQLPEREVRAIADRLKADGFLTISASGMMICPEAGEMLELAREMMRESRRLSALETQLMRALPVRRAIVVPGDADAEPAVLRDVGRAAAERLRALLRDGSILAVTGGSTVAEIARSLSVGPPMDVLVLPARGGMGRAVETQADTLAAEFARRLGGHHRLMHLPDNLSGDALREIRKVPEVRELIEQLRRADVLLYGIGRADDMARNRRLSQEEFADLERAGAVAEAFGHYFDAQGNVVHSASSMGLEVEELANMRMAVAVAAGARKADAILAVLRHHVHGLLVTDEAAARSIVRQLRLPRVQE